MVLPFELRFSDEKLLGKTNGAVRFRKSVLYAETFQYALKSSECHSPICEPAEGTRPMALFGISFVTWYLRNVRWQNLF